MNICVISLISRRRLLNYLAVQALTQRACPHTLPFTKPSLGMNTGMNKLVEAATVRQ